MLLAEGLSNLMYTKRNNTNHHTVQLYKYSNAHERNYVINYKTHAIVQKYKQASYDHTSLIFSVHIWNITKRFLNIKRL